MFWRNFIETGFFIGLLVNALLFVPQAIKLYRLKSSEDISIITFAGFNAIQAFTALHAYLIQDNLLLVGSMLAFVTCGCVTLLTFIYKLH